MAADTKCEWQKATRKVTCPQSIEVPTYNQFKDNGHQITISIALAEGRHNYGLIARIISIDNLSEKTVCLPELIKVNRFN